ncbi:NAD(P)H-dependent oxidoreductase [Streptomyces rubiginosohelvolus]|uniref:NAD(P)H-dependent oxidoreductase n=1 Tax=Streptomyces rubiginosohelvolus TaxID=67362 RepID=UPI0033AC3369
MARKLSVVVAGGGIGGLAAAAGLASRGGDVTVVERSDHTGARGSGLVLQPNGVRAADALDERIGSRIRAVGHVGGPDEVRVLMDSAGTVLAEEPTGAAAGSSGTPQIPLLRSDLHRVLLDEALTAGAAVRLATAVESYTTHPGHVTVRLSDGAFVDCDALIGADGINSAVRARMLDDGPPLYRGYTSVRGLTRGSALGQRGHVVNGRGIQLFVAPVGEDELYWTAKITASPGVWPAMGSAAARLALLEAMEGWYAPVVDLVREADPRGLVVTDIHDRDPVRQWVDGRVALLGDAAHPMVPALGQGANMALEDAAVLADTLTTCSSVPEALAVYARERMDRTAAVVLASRRQGSLDQGVDRAGEERRNARIRTEGRKDVETADVLDWQPRRVAPAKPAPVVPAGHGDTAGGAPHIVVISGSLRQGSSCDRVAAWCADRCAELGASSRVFTGQEIDFPAYRPGLAGTDTAVAGFLGALRAADGVVLVSPTYHATVSGLLKNALDYVNDIDGPVPYLEGRAVGTVAVGTAAQGAVSTLATLRTIAHALRGWPTPVGAAVTRPPEQPFGDGAPGPEEARLIEMVSQVVWLGAARGAADRRPPSLEAVA